MASCFQPGSMARFIRITYCCRWWFQWTEGPQKVSGCGLYQPKRTGMTGVTFPFRPLFLPAAFEPLLDFAHRVETIRVSQPSQRYTLLGNFPVICPEEEVEIFRGAVKRSPKNHRSRQQTS